MTSNPSRFLRSLSFSINTNHSHTLNGIPLPAFTCIGARHQNCFTLVIPSTHYCMYMYMCSVYNPSCILPSQLPNVVSIYSLVQLLLALIFIVYLTVNLIIACSLWYSMVYILQQNLRFTSLRFTSLRFTSLWFTSDHFTSLYFSYLRLETFSWNIHLEIFNKSSLQFTPEVSEVYLYYGTLM